MKKVKEIPQMTKEEMIDYLWVCYQLERKDPAERIDPAATLKLIESIATQLKKEKNNERY